MAASLLTLLTESSVPASQARPWPQEGGQVIHMLTNLFAFLRGSHNLWSGTGEPKETKGQLLGEAVSKWFDWILQLSPGLPAGESPGQHPGLKYC